MRQNTTNQSVLLKEEIRKQDRALGWVKKNTAILVVHGIGDQVPLATLDDFSRGLVREYRTLFGPDITLRHELMSKGDGENTWFDNVLRINNGDSPHFIDVYEYYWANYTEDKATWDDLNTWLQGVVRGASDFYQQEENAVFGQEYKDKSFFFDSDTGKFKPFRYKLFMGVCARLFMAINITVSGLLKLFGFFPVVGAAATSLGRKFTDTVFHKLTNVVGDIAIYNVVDPKSKFYCVRKEIAGGAIKALTYLMEKTQRKDRHGNAIDPELYYPSVIVAGHSLGSQVAYDAINKLNLHLNEGLLATYGMNEDRTECVTTVGQKQGPEQQLRGFITFGSPLDKIMFFLRERVPVNQFIKQQILAHYHGFKQRPFGAYSRKINEKEYIEADCGLVRLLEEVPWRNYYDHSDYVSGGLDYYTGLTNVDCAFPSKKIDFTHSDYWTCPGFYRDIIYNFLN